MQLSYFRENRQPFEMTFVLYAGAQSSCGLPTSSSRLQRHMPSLVNKIAGAALVKNGRRTLQCGPKLRLRRAFRFGTKAGSQSWNALVVEGDKGQEKEEFMSSPQGEQHLESSSGGHISRKEVNLKLDSVSVARPYDPAEYGKHILEISEAGNVCPRWLPPVHTDPEGSKPLLLFIPGILGVGAELVFQYETLGRLFEIQCLHVSILDNTSFEDLVSIVEEKVRQEAALPRRPIYLVGDNYGGAVSLAVAAQNTGIDLVLLLINPTTSTKLPTLQHFVSVLWAFPQDILTAAPFQLQSLFVDGGSSTNNFGTYLSDLNSVQQFLDAFLGLGRALPEIVERKLQRVKAGAQFLEDAALDSITAEVFILISGNEQILPQLPEARRISRTLPNCTFRRIANSSSSLLLEKNFDLARTFKSIGIYRQTPVKDAVENYVPPTEEECINFYESTMMMRRMVSPVFFSTASNGEVKKDLSMIPSEGPIIFIGCHSFLGLDMKIFASELLKNRSMIVRGLAHPVIFHKTHLEEFSDLTEGDLARLFGAVPVSGKNFLKLLARGENVLIYPGGAREALHRKGEAHKLFWPEQPEIIRLAAKFNATIVPVSAVGVDELIEILVDYDDITSMPGVVGDWILDLTKDLPHLRTNIDGEVGNQYLHLPLVVPKMMPGRWYFLFGRPIYTTGKGDFFRNRKNVQETYHQLKEEIETGMSYLLAKREQDPYRTFLPRFLYEFASQGTIQAPTFEP